MSDSEEDAPASASAAVGSHEVAGVKRSREQPSRRAKAPVVALDSAHLDVLAKAAADVLDRETSDE